MLTDALKQTIQDAYRQFLSKRRLQPRYGQKLMIAAIANTIGAIPRDNENNRDGNGHICVVEAGTGTGKTIAYLIAAIPVAKAFNKKLVISTATVALQEQIIYKDLPDLHGQTGLQFSFSIAKGRGRYLCLSKLDFLLKNNKDNSMAQPIYEDAYISAREQSVCQQVMPIYEDMFSAITTHQWDGDRDSWPQALDQKQWAPLTTNHRQCTGRHCPHIGNCSFFKARESLENVDCIVANHDLVLADLALGGGAILPQPEDTLYVFDEGHHLPDKALNHFAYHTRIYATACWLEDNKKTLALLVEAVGSIGQISHYAKSLSTVFGNLKQQLDACFPYCRQLVDGEVSASGESGRDNTRQYRFKAGKVTVTLLEMAAELANGFDRLAGILASIALEIQVAMEDSLAAIPAVDLEKWFLLIGSWQMRTDVNLALWRSYSILDKEFDKESDKEVEKENALPIARWLTLVEFSDSVDIEICSSPILAAGNLTTSLWDRCFGAVVTSASLTVSGCFDRFKMHAGTGEYSHYAIVPSPFDYSNALLQIPEGAVEAHRVEAHTENVIELLSQLLDKRHGSLVLFSSYKQMHDVYNRLTKSWQALVLMQGDHSKQTMLAKHKKRIDANQCSVLFGLASFAEGVDLPGSYCRHVIITKLPFAVPDDPVAFALAEWIESRGGNPFMEITVPDAALKLLQACGRLLRTETDSGVISILDRRILTKRYGQTLINSLPPYRRDR